MERALRVALIQQGRIVEDRTFTGKAKISVGSDERCTFLVPMADLPTMTRVFDVTRSGTTLLFDPALDGRVSLDGADASLAALTSCAEKRGSQWALPLPVSAKGRVSIGEVSLLFQFVEPPKPTSPAPLPKGSRGLLAQIDRSFLVVLGLSLAAHFAGVGWISSQPVPVERDLTIDDFEPDRWAKAVLPMPKRVEPTTAPTAGVEPTAQPKAPTASAPKRPAVAQASVSERVHGLGLLGIIGARGDGRGAVGDVLDGAPNDVAAALKDAAKHGLGVASVEDATASRRRGADEGEVANVELVGTNGVKRVELEEHTAVAVTARVQTEKVEVNSEFPDEQGLSRWLNQRKSAVQSCYERELKRTPTLAGRLVIRFVVDTRGRVGQVGFTEDTLRNPAVEQCISGLMRAWVLPFTPEDEVPVALPFIFSATN